jgi:hypothetical protein
LGLIFLCALGGPVRSYGSAAPLVQTIFPVPASDLGFPYDSGVRINPHDPDEFFAVVNHQFLKSTDRGVTWRGIGDGLPDPLSVMDFYQADRAIAFHPTVPDRMLIGGARGGFGGVPCQSDDGGETWFPLNICEHGPVRADLNYKHTAQGNTALYSPAHPDTVYFSVTAQADCQGIFISRDGGRTLLPNPLCPRYDTVCSRDPGAAACVYAKPYEPKPVCGSPYFDDVLLDLNPFDDRESYGNDGHSNLGLISDPSARFTSSGLRDEASGQICARQNVYVEYPEGRFKMHGYPRYMPDGSVVAVNEPFRVDCASNPAGRCKVQCARPGAVICRVPAALTRYSREEEGNRIFTPLAETEGTYSSQKLLLLPGGLLLYLDQHEDHTALKGFNTDPKRPAMVTFDKGSPGLFIRSMEELPGPGFSTDVYYLKFNAANGRAYSKLLRLRVNGDGTFSGPVVVSDFEDRFTGVRTFHWNEALYANTYDSRYLYRSRDLGKTFEAIPPAPSRSGLPTAYFRYLDTREGVQIMDINAGAVRRITLNPSPDPAGPGTYDWSWVLWQDQAFSSSSICTANYLDVMADPKSPPGEVWAWFATDAGIWRNKMFGYSVQNEACRSGDPDAPACVYPCWDLVSGGYGCDSPPCGEAPGEIPSKDFANYAYKIRFDPRDPEKKTVYAATKSGVWKGVEGESRDGCTSAVTGRRFQDSKVFFSKVLASGPVIDVLFSGSHVYAVTTAGILRSADDGSWKSVYPGPVSAIAAVPGRPEAVVAADATGLSLSEDAGETWTPFLPLPSRELPVHQAEVRVEGGKDIVYYLTNDGYLKKVPAVVCPYPDDPPMGLAAVVDERNRVNLRWQAVPSALSYEIYRSEGQGAPVPMATVSQTFYADATVQGGKTYSYSVRTNFSDVCFGYLSARVAAAPAADAPGR